MEIDANFISALQGNSISVLHLMTISFMRPLGLLFGFIGITWALGGTASLIRTAIAFGLAIPVMFFEGNNLLQYIASSSYLNITILVIKEFGVGFALGLVVSIPFWIVQFGGSMLDSYRGESNSGGQDPTGGEISTLARYHLVTAFLVFASMAGFAIMIGEFYKSYQFWPITSTFPEIKNVAFVKLLDLLNYLMIQALIVAAPLLFLMISVDFLSIICGKIAKGFSAMDISFILKNLLTIVLLPLMAMIFVHFLQSNYFKENEITSVLRQVLQ